MFCAVILKSAEKIAFVGNIVFRILQYIYEGSKKGRSQGLCPKRVNQRCLTGFYICLWLKNQKSSLTVLTKK